MHEQSTVSYSPTPHGRDPAVARARAVTLLLALAWSHPPNSPVCSSLFLPGNAFRHPVGLLGSRLGRAPPPRNSLPCTPGPARYRARSSDACRLARWPAPCTP